MATIDSQANNSHKRIREERHIGISNKTLNSNDSFEGKKVGKIAQEYFIPLLESGRISQDILNKLQSYDFSKYVFNCSFCILKKVKNPSNYDQERFEKMVMQDIIID